MILGLLTLLVALVISGIAAWYSIIGLTALFAGAWWPIIAMGGALEAGKLVAASWLFHNWETDNLPLKRGLISVIAGLMLLTSIGIFGFL